MNQSLEERAISDATVMERPYRHMIIPTFFDHREAGELLSWLKNGAAWWRQERDFYVQDSCENLNSSQFVAEGAILSRERRKLFARSLARRFEIPLAGEFATVCAHRLRPGDCIGVHTDDPSAGTEIFRLMITLGEDKYEDRFGGHFCLLTSRNPSDVKIVTRPLHNIAVAFELSSRSFHAVNEVCEKDRYSIVFGFWHRDQVRKVRPKVVLRAPSDGLHQLSTLTRLKLALQGLGAAQIPHSGRTLLDHLIGVSSILLDWECDEDIWLAGLFHSIYGTSTFDNALLSYSNRRQVSELIGENAERLVWLYSVVRFSEMYRCGDADTFQGRHRHNEEALLLSERDVASLNLISLANSIDQGESFDDPGTRFEVRQAFERLKAHVPPKAFEAVNELTG